LLAAQDTSLTGMSFDEVQAGVRAYLTERLPAETAGDLLGAEEFNLDARLEQLARWRVVTRWQDPARTGEDFLRRRDRYQLTPLAARLHSFWTREPDADQEAAADLTLAPRAIHDRLATFGDAVRHRTYPAAAAELSTTQVSSWWSKCSSWRTRRHSGDTTRQPTPPTSVCPIRAHRRTATRGASWRGSATCTGSTAPRSTKRSC
jgi:Protein of unknown function (DUF2397)